jgi:hypothetical protein
VDSHHGCLALNELHESASLGVAVGSSDDVDLLKGSEASEHVMQVQLVDSLWQHAHEYLVLSLRLALRGTNLKGVCSLNMRVIVRVVEKLKMHTHIVQLHFVVQGVDGTRC